MSVMDLDQPTDDGQTGDDVGADGLQAEVLSESESWRLLRTVDVGRVAMASGGDVEIFPINYVVDHGTIVFRTAVGTKLSHVSGTADIAFEADDSDLENGVAWSVVLKGSAETIHGRIDVFDAFEIELRPWHSSRKPFFVRISPRSISGRRFVRTG